MNSIVSAPTQPKSQPLVIASQLGEVSAGLLQQLPTASDSRSIQIQSFSPDSFDSLHTAEILLASPQGWPSQAPVGWPFNLKWIQLVSSGIDFYPQWLLDGITITTSRGATALPMVEYVLAALFQQHKQWAQIEIHSPAQWQRRNIALLAGSTLGIVGYGAIGQYLAQTAQALGMQVKILRRNPQAMPDKNIQQVHCLEDLISQVDHLVLAAPATLETHHLINARILARAKPNLHLINVARGSLIDQHALLQALDQGSIAYATLDVTTPEPLPENHPLYRHARVSITPHTSATASNVISEVIRQFKHNLNLYLNGQPLDNVVDLKRGY